MVEREEAVFVAHGASRLAAAYRLTQAIYLLFGFIEVLIAIRLVLRFLGANPTAPFSAALYGITGPFVAPFIGVFGALDWGGGVLEPHSILAIIVYALLAWLLAKIVWVLMVDTRSDVETHTRTYDSTLR
jgi:uncharacterized protein YggT (Ycf19 family)